MAADRGRASEQQSRRLEALLRRHLDGDDGAWEHFGCQRPRLLAFSGASASPGTEDLPPSVIYIFVNAHRYRFGTPPDHLIFPPPAILALNRLEYQRDHPEVLESDLSVGDDDWSPLCDQLARASSATQPELALTAWTTAELGQWYERVRDRVAKRVLQGIQLDTWRLRREFPELPPEELAARTGQEVGRVASSFHDASRNVDLHCIAQGFTLTARPAGGLAVLISFRRDSRWRTAGPRGDEADGERRLAVNYLEPALAPDEHFRLAADSLLKTVLPRAERIRLQACGDTPLAADTVMQALTRPLIAPDAATAQAVRHLQQRLQLLGFQLAERELPDGARVVHTWQGRRMVWRPLPARERIA